MVDFTVFIAIASATELVAERERPRQRLWPVTFQDMQVGAADAARADLDQRGLFADLRPRHVADHRPRARAVIGADANFLHASFSRASSVLIESEPKT
jgi:hypothetical protein